MTAVRPRSRSTPRRSCSCPTAIRSTTASARSPSACRRARRPGCRRDGFVFCCFNNNYKITPPVFDVWMRLLQAVPGSVLWLLRDNAGAERNLRREAQARGVDPARLVFAGAADARRIIWRAIGWPICSSTRCPTTPTPPRAMRCGRACRSLTCLGNAFAGRVGGEPAARRPGLPELVTHSLADYEALALRLATDPALLAASGSGSRRTAQTCPLFDTDRFRAPYRGRLSRPCGRLAARRAAARLYGRSLARVTGHAPRRYNGAHDGAVHAVLEAGARPRHRLPPEGRSWRRPKRSIGKSCRRSRDHFDAQHLLGIIRHQQGRSAEALELVDRRAQAQSALCACALEPRADPLRAAALRRGAARASIRRWRSSPTAVEAHNNRGNTLQRLKRNEEALASFDRALALEPRYVEAHNNRGNALQGLKRYEEALASYDRALALRPDYRRRALQSRHRAARSSAGPRRARMPTTARWRCGPITPRRCSAAAMRSTSSSGTRKRSRATRRRSRCAPTIPMRLAALAEAALCDLRLGAHCRARRRGSRRWSPSARRSSIRSR